ncbi:MAG: ribosome silencing factor [Candidatus Binatia bacterium]|nr:ribosome silencing factor [Candidatus Binatia bacterium]
MESWERALLISHSALDKKAYDLVLLDVRGASSFTDYFIICSGRSDRQVQSIAEGIQENLVKMRICPLAVEGLTRGQWVLMDFSDVVVHAFYQPVREFYDLEGLWAHAPRVDLPDPYSTLANQLRIRDEQVS